MRIKLLLAFTLVTNVVFAQKPPARYIIIGNVKNNTGKLLPDAVIKVISTNATYIPDRGGLYFVNIPEGEHLVNFSAPNYQAKEMWVSLHKDTVLNVILESPYGGLSLDDVVIHGALDRVSNPQLGLSIIDGSTFEKMPAFLGEKDIVRSLQLLPGVSAASEGSTEMNVRGGSSDQNLILLDNIPLYSSSHLFGMYSSFNPLIVKSASLYTGAFPTSFGGKISSVMDVVTQTANMKKLKGSAEMGLTSAKVALEIPLIKNKSSLLLAGRRSYFDLFTRLSSGKDVEDFNFYDFNGIWRYRINDKNELKLSTYLEGDQFRYKTRTGNLAEDALKKGQRALSFNWKNFRTATWTNELSITHNGHTNGMMERRELSDPTKNYTQYFDSKINDLSVHYDFKAKANSSLDVIGGLSFINHQLQPGKFSGIDQGTSFSVSSLAESTVNELNAHMGTVIHIKDKQLQVGMRVNQFMTLDRAFSSIEPRLSYYHPVGNDLSFKAAYSRMSQPMQRLVNPGLGMPLDILFPADKRFHPQRADILSAGFSKNFNTTRDRYTFSVEAYYKKMGNVLSFRDGYDTRSVIYNSYGGGLQANHVHDILVSGKGKVMGMDLLLEKKSGDLSGWISYSWMRGRNKFDQLNQGNWFRSQQDRPHILNLVLNWQMSESWTMGASWTYASGQPITVPEAVHQAYDPTFGNGLAPSDYHYLFTYGERNSFRMKAFHKLDVSFNYKFDLGNLDATLNLGVYNLYNRANASFYYLDSKFDKSTMTSLPVLKSASMFPAIPAISLKVNF